MKKYLVVASLLASACSGAGTNSAASVDGGATSDLAPSNALIVARPYQYDVPANYDASKPTPLVILLHGYGVNGYVQRAYFGLGPLIDQKGFLLAYPDGTVDSKKSHFWNATDGCCNFDNSPVDDVAYIDAVIDDMSAHFNVDKKRIFLTGHSNGGFMSHRYACDRAARVAAFVALAGDNWLDESKCNPSEPVAALQVHGDMDMDVIYNGMASIMGQGGYPSAHDSVKTWAKKNGCALSPTDTSAPPRDLDSAQPGAETKSERWTGCKGGWAELWTIQGAGHIPNFIQPAWPEAIWSFFEAHPKP